MRSGGHNGSFRIYLRGYVVATPEEWGKALDASENELPVPPVDDSRYPGDRQLDARGVFLRQMAEDRMLAFGEQIGQAATAMKLPAGVRVDSVIWSSGHPGHPGFHWEINFLGPDGLRKIALENAEAEALARGDEEVIAGVRHRILEELGSRIRRRA